MKRYILSVFLMLIFVPSVLSADFNFDAAVGYFAPNQTELARKRLAASCDLGVGASYLFVRAGGRFWVVSSDEKNFDVPGYGDVSCKTDVNSISGLLFAGVRRPYGFFPRGVYPYGAVGVGYLYNTTRTRWELGSAADEPVQTLALSKGQQIFAVIAGIEARFGIVGVFFELDYFIADKVDMETIDVSGNTVDPGSVDPKGVAILIGARF